MGIFAKNRVEWLLVDIANVLYGFTLVPFYDTLGNFAIHLFYRSRIDSIHFRINKFRNHVSISRCTKNNFISKREILIEKFDFL